MKIKPYWFLLFFFLFSYSAYGQDINAHSPTPNSGSHQQRKADKKKLKQQKQLTKAIEIGKKRHLKNQTKNTKKMMRKSKRASTQWNEDKKTFFLKRWFTKKHH